MPESRQFTILKEMLLFFNVAVAVDVDVDDPSCMQSTRLEGLQGIYLSQRGWPEDGRFGERGGIVRERVQRIMSCTLDQMSRW